MTIDSQSIGTRIAEARAATGLTLAEVAVTIPQFGDKPFTAGAVSHWEKGRNLGPIVRFAHLCRTLGVSADHVLGLDDEQAS